MNKNRIIGVIVALVVLGLGGLMIIGVCIGAYLWWSSRAGGVEDVAERLPPDTSALIVAQGIHDLAWEFRGIGASTPGATPDPAELEAREKFKQTMGFELDDPQGWASTGFDFLSPWAVAMWGSTDPDQAEWYALLPVSDGQKATTFLLGVMERQGVVVNQASFGTHAGYLVDKDAAFAVDGDFLVAVASPRRDFDAGTALRVLLDRDREVNLWGRAEFKGVLEAGENNWQLMGYVSPELVAQGWQEADREARDLFGTLGAAGAGYFAHLTDQALDSRLVLIQNEDVPAVLVGGPDPLADEVSGPVAAVSRLGLDYGLLWTLARQDPDTAASLDKAAQSIRDEWGVDLQSDVVDNLKGPITIVAVGEAEHVGVAAWVGVKDTNKASSALEAVAGRLRNLGLALSTDKVEGQSWYWANEVGVRLAGDRLVVAGGDGRVAAMKADLADKNPSFVGALPDKVRADLQSGPPIYAYLDMNQALALAGKNPMAGRMLDSDSRLAAQAISGVSFGASAKGKQVVIESAWHAPSEGFAAAFKRIAAEQAKLATYKSQRAEVLANVETIRGLLAQSSIWRGGQFQCGAVAAARSHATTPYTWEPEPCWTAIGWTPSAPVRGGYWITTERGGWFPLVKVHGVVDLDGDGNLAEIEADVYSGASLKTEDGVF